MLDSTLVSTAAQYPVQGNVCGYVTELQIHMALQARHLLPGFEHNTDQRLSPVHQAQADMERAASRQWF